MATKDLPMRLWTLTCPKENDNTQYTHGFMLFGTLGVDVFSTSDSLYSNMQVRLRLLRARPSFYKISDNPNVSRGIVACSLYTRPITLKVDYHKKRTCLHILPLSSTFRRR